MRDALEHKAACRIQTEWLRHRAAVADAERRRRERAATKIQSVARMYAVRKQWPTRRRRLDAVKSSTVQTEERQDRAAMRIQAVWRGHKARDTTLELLENRDRDKARRLRHEAASSRRSWRVVPGCDGTSGLDGVDARTWAPLPACMRTGDRARRELAACCSWCCRRAVDEALLGLAGRDPLWLLG